MGEVRQATDLRLMREVAIKLFDASRWSSEKERTRFELEARAAAAIAHPNVVTVYDIGFDGPLALLVMECLPGNSLASEIRFGALTPARTVTVATEVLAGLSASHAVGVLHRDLKPSNILFAQDGRAKLADFGIAHFGVDLELTDAGSILGTPLYLAPERLAGKPATERSDVYSVGVVCYEALAGKRPFEGTTPMEIARAITEGRVTPLHEVNAVIPRPLADVVMRAISMDPARRPATAAEFSQRLGVSLAEELPTTTVAIEAVDDVEATAVLAPVVAEPSTPQPSVVPQPAVTPRRRVSRLAMVLGVLAGLGIVAAGVASTRDDGNNPPGVSNSESTSSLPSELEEPFADLEDAVSP